MTVTTEAIQDVEFFKKKLAATTDPDDQEKLKRQIELLEDAVVIYTLTQPAR